MKSKLAVFFIVIMFFFPLLLSAVQNRGVKEILLSGGKNGEVLFPHGMHQASLKDCNMCHDLFPQVLGSIEKLKANKKLEIKQVMKQCRDCHKGKKKIGKKTGPIGCRGCHRK